MTTKTHGGRRHGLSESGKSKPKQFRLGDKATDALDLLMEETGLTASEIVRTLLLNPWACEMVMDQDAAGPRWPIDRAQRRPPWSRE